MTVESVGMLPKSAAHEALNATSRSASCTEGYPGTDEYSPSNAQLEPSPKVHEGGFGLTIKRSEEVGKVDCWTVFFVATVCCQDLLRGIYLHLKFVLP